MYLIFDEGFRVFVVGEFCSEFSKVREVGDGKVFFVLYSFGEDFFGFFYSGKDVRFV